MVSCPMALADLQMQKGRKSSDLGMKAPLVWWFRGWLVFVATWVLGFLGRVFDISLKEFKNDILQLVE